MLIDPAGARPKADLRLVQQIKTWVTEALHVGEDTTLMVTEMRCTTPDCPPIKTVIALMETAQPIRQYKIHKPLADILQEDVAQLATLQPKIVGSSVEQPADK
ncbi:MAG TPA: hypothetical protein VHZ51_15710 [Ktedonobacteraceae bacterium]|jgi:hypothetical protein|nr:hypothetical protein [Ktedonobacteraceae bacterium]